MNIFNLKPYSKYTESDLQFVSRIPSEWKIVRTKSHFRLAVEKSGSNHSKELLSVYTHIGVRPRKDLEARGNKASSTDNYWIVNRGDIVVNKLLAWMGAIGVSHYEGVTSPAYDVLRPKVQLNTDYYHYLFRTKNYLRLFKARSRGIMDMRLRLYFDEFGQIPLISPPLDDQNKIVAFLNSIDRKVSLIISEKKKTLSLTSEIRQSIVAKAIQNDDTKWMRLSSVVDLVYRDIGRNPKQKYKPIGLFNRGRGIFHKPEVFGKDLGDSNFQWVSHGDLVISGQFAWEGAIALAQEIDNETIASHRYFILKGKPEYVITEYVLAFLRTEYGQLLLEYCSRGAAGRNKPLNIKSLLKEKIPIPNLKEQIKIKDVIEHENSLKKSVESTIAGIREYQLKINTDVVLGNLDVRNVTLPDALFAEDNISSLNDDSDDEIQEDEL